MILNSFKHFSGPKYKTLGSLLVLMIYLDFNLLFQDLHMIVMKCFDLSSFWKMDSKYQLENSNKTRTNFNSNLSISSFRFQCSSYRMTLLIHTTLLYPLPYELVKMANGTDINKCNTKSSILGYFFIL